MIKKLPSSVDFQILGQCNLECPFCFGPRHEIPAMPLDRAISVLGVLRDLGVSRIVFTGGEPTLFGELPRLLASAKSLGMVTVLNSNGLLLRRRIHDIAPHLDWLSLPLDGATSATNALMRRGNPRHFEEILDLIPKIQTDYPDLSLKLGTVVTRLNLSEAADILNVVTQAGGRPSTWKLYQISPSSYGKDNYDSLQVSQEDFERVAESARMMAQACGVTFVKYTNLRRNGQYLFIDPRGNVLVVVDDDYKKIGNVFEDIDSVVDTWASYATEEKIRQNFDETF